MAMIEEEMDDVEDVAGPDDMAEVEAEAPAFTIVSKKEATQLSSWIRDSVDLGTSKSYGKQSMNQMLAQKSLGLSEPLSQARQERYEHLLSKARLGSFLQPLQQPVDKDHIVDGAMQKCEIPLALLLDPHSLHKSFHSVVPEHGFKNIKACIAAIETQKKLLTPSSTAETTFAAIATARLNLSWDVITRLLTPALANSVSVCFDTPTKFQRWQKAVISAMSLITDELTHLDLLYQKKTDKAKVSDFGAGILKIHLERMREFPIKPDDGVSSNFFTNHRTAKRVLATSLTVGSMKKKEKEFLKTKVAELKKKDFSFYKSLFSTQQNNRKRKRESENSNSNNTNQDSKPIKNKKKKNKKRKKNKSKKSSLNSNSSN